MMSRFIFVDQISWQHWLGHFVPWQTLPQWQSFKYEKNGVKIN
jgi:hypothetical protein